MTPPIIPIINPRFDPGYESSITILIMPVHVVAVLAFYISAIPA